MGLKRSQLNLYEPMMLSFGELKVEQEANPFEKKTDFESLESLGEVLEPEFQSPLYVFRQSEEGKLILQILERT